MTEGIWPIRKINRLLVLFFTLSLFFLMHGCSAFKGGHDQPYTPSTWPASSSKVSAQLHEQYTQWQGIRHRTGGLSKSGIDCSGFVMLTFNEKFAMKLPRTAQEQARLGYPVSKKNMVVGDLVFFKTPHTRHVGIYVGNQQFMHVSRKEGVILSQLNNPYWQKYYWTSRRLKLTMMGKL